MHTPDQARELWCPMVRIARREDVDTGGEHFERMPTKIVAGCNTDALGRNRVPASCTCIADKCAMWRWVPVTGTHGEMRIEKKPVMLVSGGSEMRSFEVTVQVPDSPTHGWCGMAGRPV